MNLRKMNEKFKSFALVETIEDFVVEENGATLVRQVKYHRIPNMLEPSMEKVNGVWRFYSKKFMQNPRIASVVTRLSSSGDINVSTGLKVLLDMKEQMEDYKQKRDLDGMIMTMRTMYHMLTLLGYKKGPHSDDEYQDVKHDTQARKLLEMYGLIKKEKPVDRSTWAQVEDFILPSGTTS